MSAEVLPFPVVRRQRQIHKTASYMATLDYRHAEGHLREQRRRLEESFRRKTVAEQLIRAEVTAYEAAIRAVLMQLRIVGGGAA